MKRIAALLLIAFQCLLLQATSPRQDAVNRQVFERIASAVSGKISLPTSELTAAIALEMRGTPYVAGTLETIPEELNIYLDKTDCILFVETCLCLALTFKSDNPTYESFVEQVRQMRYRDGVVDGYPSRLHYTSEWLQQNAARGILSEYTCRYGTPLKQSFSFMSTHPDSYKQLKGNPSAVAEIRKAERRLEAAGGYCIITQQRLRAGGIDLHEGDIVCFVTKVAGLDISHVGLLHKVGGEWHFIHASSKAGKVIVEPKKLSDYATNGVRLVKIL